MNDSNTNGTNGPDMDEQKKRAADTAQKSADDRQLAEAQRKAAEDRQNAIEAAYDSLQNLPPESGNTPAETDEDESDEEDDVYDDDMSIGDTSDEEDEDEEEDEEDEAEAGNGAADAAAPTAVVSADGTPVPAQKKKKTKKKDRKIFPKKKLPKIFRKAYSERKLKRAILKPVSIPRDKAFLQGLFVKGGDAKKALKLAVADDRLFSKREIARLRSLAKDIESHKGRFMLLPFAALIAFIMFIASTFMAIKNPLLKKVLTSVAQDAVGAKVDIGSVNLRVLGASLTIQDVAVGNKDSVMKNIVQFDKLDLNFNLTQALRGKFDAENLELSGIAFNTDRTVSCELPEDKKKKKEEAKESLADSEFVKNLKAGSQAALTDLQNQAVDLLGGSDVESIISNLRSQLTSIEQAKSAEAQVQGLVTKWTGKPDEVEAKVKEYKASVKKIQDIDVKKIKDPMVLQEYITTINSIMNDTKALTESARALKDEVLADANGVKTTTEAITNAVKADRDMLKSRLTAIVDTVKNAKKLLNDALETVAYSMLGEYYPYLRKGISYAEQIKQNSVTQTVLAEAEKNKADAAKKKEGSNRLAGTTFWFGDNNPTFLIERAYVSGKDFDAKIEEITNDQNARNKTTKLTGNFAIAGISHAADLVLDTRAASTAPLIQANYTGDGIKALFDGAKVALKSGVPSLEGLAKISLNAAAGSGFLSAGGSVDLTPIKMTTDGFASAIISKYYQEALDAIKTLLVGFNLDFSELEGMNLQLLGDFADKFTESLTAIVKGIGNEAKDKALARLNEEITGSSNAYFNKAKEFLGIENGIDLANTDLDSMQGILESKKQELQTRITELGTGKLQEKLSEKLGEEAAGSISNTAGDAANKLFDKLKNVPKPKKSE